MQRFCMGQHRPLQGSHRQHLSQTDQLTPTAADADVLFRAAVTKITMPWHDARTSRTKARERNMWWPIENGGGPLKLHGNVEPKIATWLDAVRSIHS